MKFYTFVENELREFSPARSLVDAVRKVRDGEADGLTVDTDSASYEVMPGREIVSWFGEDVHDF